MGILEELVKPITDLAAKFIPDKDKLNEFRNGLIAQALDYQKTVLQSQTQIITAEAQGASWLQRSWRPITMLVFVGLITATILGFTPPGLSDDLKMQLFEIIKIGLGGYVVGRSAEKVAATIAPMMKKKD